MRIDKLEPLEILDRLNKSRARRNIKPVSRSAVYRYVGGVSHKRGRKETRGRKPILGTKDVQTLNRIRRKMIKSADNETRITYSDLIEEAGYEDTCCQRLVEDALRGLGVRYRPPRQKNLLTQEDAKNRLRVAKSWLKKPARFWSEKVHAYVDNKAFPMPLTPAQRAKFRQTQIRGHLRTASEGIQPGFTKPKTNHNFVGMPSVASIAGPPWRILAASTAAF